MEDVKYVLLSSVTNVNKEIVNQMKYKINNKSKVVYIRGKKSSSKINFENVCEFYKTFGIYDVEYYDLDNYQKHTILNAIQNCDVLHLGGGNMFEFTNRVEKGMYHIDFKQLIPSLNLVVGESAGAILLTNNVKVAELLGEGKANNQKGLEILDLSFLPHFNTLDESNAVKISQYKTENNNVSIYAVNDGGGILVSQSKKYKLFDAMKI